MFFPILVIGEARREAVAALAPVPARDEVEEGGGKGRRRRGHLRSSGEARVDGPRGSSLLRTNYREILTLPSLLARLSEWVQEVFIQPSNGRLEGKLDM